MNRNRKRIKTAIAVFVLASIEAQQSYAGAFSLYTESSAAAIGNFAAGIAAEGADASIGWYNPAGLVLIKEQQAVFSGAGVFPSTQITGTSTFTTAGFPPYVQSFDGLQGAENALVPALHYVKPLGSRAAFGISAVAPFGLATDWGSTSPVRYSATRSQLTTINLSPELGGLITNNFSIGAGIDIQTAQVTFDNILGSPAALQFLESIGGLVTPTTLDSYLSNTGHSVGFGFHAGVLQTFNNNHSRVGLNYQSGVSHRFQGNSVLTGRLADPELIDPHASFISDVLSSNVIHLPDVTTLSAYHDVNSRLALLGSIVYTGWDSFKTIQLNNVAAYSPETGMQTLLDVVTTQNYRDAWRFAVGANYWINERWMLRTGGGYDQTPTINAERDVRLPDGNRWALSLGSHYQVRPNLGIDIGYSYLFGVGNPSMNKTQILGESSANIINATANNHAQLFGAQLVWDIDAVPVASK